MKTKLISRLGSFVGFIIHSGLIAVGAITVIGYINDNYPTAYSIFRNIFHGAIAIWFLAVYVVIPFIKGRSEGMGADPEIH